MSQKKPEILILGTFHMAEQEGLDSENRQVQIEELVSGLDKFKPTKIAVEMIPEESDSYNEEFNQYKRGTYKLAMNEIYQVAFRLGAKLQHPQLYATDWMGDSELSYGEVEEWAKKNQPDLLAGIYEGLDFPVLSESKSIVDYYKELNEPALIDKLHRVHLHTARIGNITNNVGMRWLSWWYKRNLIMFANLTRLAESGQERILFIVGVGHSSIVTKFVEESGLFEVADPRSYLE